MKRTIPLFITAIGGFVLIAAVFSGYTQTWGEVAAIWFDVLAAIAFLLGGGNLMKIHLRKISGRGAGWAYSGVTLGLMHGSAPHAMILVHQATRTMLIHHHNVPIPPLPELIDLHERVMRPLFPSKVVAIALNCVDLDDDAARDAIARVENQTGLPTTDVVRFGPDKLADVVEGILG